jgi:hypothetical protein
MDIMDRCDSCITEVADFNPNMEFSLSIAETRIDYVSIRDLMCTVLMEIKVKIPTCPDSPVNRALIHSKIVKLCEEHHIKPQHVAQMVFILVECYFCPTRNQLMAARMPLTSEMRWSNWLMDTMSPKRIQ